MDSIRLEDMDSIAILSNVSQQKQPVRSHAQKRSRPGHSLSIFLQEGEEAATNRRSCLQLKNSLEATKKVLSEI